MSVIGARLCRYSASRSTYRWRLHVWQLARRSKAVQAPSVSLYLAAIIHFYEMNDVTIKWKKLKKFKAKHYNIIEDKPYTREQIKKLLDAATLRDKCFILLCVAPALGGGH